jgi:DNA modification methylase
LPAVPTILDELLSAGPCVLETDVLDGLRALPSNSLDAIVTDPPYGLEFMGAEWDSFQGDAWRSGAGMTAPGIGDRPTAWPAFGGDTANATCSTCKGRMRGKKVCECPEPAWVVKGQPRQLQDSTYQTGHYGRNTSVRHGIGASYGTEGAKSSRAFGEWCYQWAVEALRVAKPGAHILAFGGTRTYHRLVCALEDAGWEVRDSLQLFWTYGSGFPKSLDVSKAIDKALGKAAERAFKSVNPAQRPYNTEHGETTSGWKAPTRPDKTHSASPQAREFEGWGTALKPAYEPIVVARKPLIGTVARNVLRYRTGGLNIAGCSLPSGRWPGNAILCHAPECVCTGTDGPETVETWECVDGCVDGCPVKLMEEQSPGASRFFYSVKANANDRWVAVSCSEGCAFHGAKMSRRAAKASATKPVKGARDGLCRSCGGHRSHAGHPTVKPEGLMRYLARLVTPPGGVVLDPFCGSGSTGVAVVKEGFRFLGVDKTPAYVQLSRARLADVLDKLSKNQPPVEEADLDEEELEEAPEEEG